MEEDVKQITHTQLNYFDERTLGEEQLRQNLITAGESIVGNEACGTTLHVYMYFL